MRGQLPQGVQDEDHPRSNGAGTGQCHGTCLRVGNGRRRSFRGGSRRLGSSQRHQGCLSRIPTPRGWRFPNSCRLGSSSSIQPLCFHGWLVLEQPKPSASGPRSPRRIHRQLQGPRRVPCGVLGQRLPLDGQQLEGSWLVSRRNARSRLPSRRSRRLGVRPLLGQPRPGIG